jgi:hypothetical protein
MDKTAVDELTVYWTSATSEERLSITKACAAVDRRLADRPDLEGESRSHNLRIMFEAPLAVTFHFDPSLQQVTVARIRLCRRRK